ncbi:MAG: prepilin peptidase [Coriobacteriales bacterium]|jgi:leader peptidase (prepilin peptidase)/N-methyltransferase|nr:prepilin peptidase [Coriobacteriales bacterium]
MLSAVYIVIFVFVFAIGSVVGSFLNVLIYRLPLKLDFVKGSSFCPHCKHKLGALDLVPVLSYLFLGRRCRYCKEPISPRYMLVELLGGTAALLSYAAFLPPVAFSSQPIMGSAPALDVLPTNPWALAAATLYFLVLCILISISFIDADIQEIPNSLVIALLILGVLSLLVGPQIPLLSRGIGFVAVSLPFLLLTLAIPGAFGGGDIKLMAAAGFLLGWQNVVLATFISFLLGGSWGIYLLALKKKGRKEHFAFGPALCVGIAVALFFGAPLISWYLSFYGLG